MSDEIHKPLYARIQEYIADLDPLWEAGAGSEDPVREGIQRGFRRQPHDSPASAYRSGQ